MVRAASFHVFSCCGGHTPGRFTWCGAESSCLCIFGIYDIYLGLRGQGHFLMKRAAAVSPVPNAQCADPASLVEAALTPTLPCRRGLLQVRRLPRSEALPLNAGLSRCSHFCCDPWRFLSSGMVWP